MSCGCLISGDFVLLSWLFVFVLCLFLFLRRWVSWADSGFESYIGLIGCSLVDPFVIVVSPGPAPAPTVTAPPQTKVRSDRATLFYNPEPRIWTVMNDTIFPETGQGRGFLQNLKLYPRILIVK